MQSITERVERITPEEAVAAERREQAAVERRAAAERYSRLRELMAAVGPRYETATLSSFETTNAAQRAVVESLAEVAAGIGEAINSGRNLVLYGPRGTGKDHLLVAMLRAAIADGWSIAWRDGQTMFGEFRDAIKQERPDSDVLRPLTAAGVLALSDPTPPLGDIKSEYQLSMLFRIVDRRYRDLRPTWVTINAASAEEAEKRIAPNIIDRLTHGALVLRCNWKSYRSGR